MRPSTHVDEEIEGDEWNHGHFLHPNNTLAVLDPSEAASRKTLAPAGIQDRCPADITY